MKDELLKLSIEELFELLTQNLEKASEEVLPFNLNEHKQPA